MRLYFQITKMCPIAVLHRNEWEGPWVVYVGPLELREIHKRIPGLKNTYLYELKKL